MALLSEEEIEQLRELLRGAYTQGYMRGRADEAAGAPEIDFDTVTVYLGKEQDNAEGIEQCS